LGGKLSLLDVEFHSFRPTKSISQQEFERIRVRHLLKIHSDEKLSVRAAVQHMFLTGAYASNAGLRVY